MMTKKDKLETLMLLSALESYCMAQIDVRLFPDYLIAQTERVVDLLKADILESDAVHLGKPDES
jgi:hypothetical protein